MAFLVTIYIILILMNAVTAGIWLSDGNRWLGFMHIFLMILWGIVLYLALAF